MLGAERTANSSPSLRISWSATATIPMAATTFALLHPGPITRLIPYFAFRSVEEFDGHEQPVSYEWQPGPLHLLPGAIPLLRWPCRGLENVQRPIFLF